MIHPMDHAAKVARIAAQLRAHDGSRPVSLRKKAVSHQVPKGRDLRHRDPKIDVGDLTEILHIDPEKRICVAESGVTIEYGSKEGKTTRELKLAPGGQVLISKTGDSKLTDLKVGDKVSAVLTSDQSGALSVSVVRDTGARPKPAKPDKPDDDD